MDEGEANWRLEIPVGLMGFGMAENKRELICTPTLTWLICRCSGCSWARKFESTSVQASQDAFDAHDCEDYPIPEYDPV